MIRLWDYETCACGKGHKDECIDSDRVPETLTCECGATVGWVPEHSTAQIHRSLSTLYNRGHVDPQTGVDYESYEHKKAVMKAQGREEGEIERIDDIMNEERPDTGVRNPDVGVIDARSDDEAIQKLRDMQNQRGDVDRLQSGNPNRPMQDSWVKF